jgi:DNA primase
MALIDFKSAKERLDLVDVASKYVELHKSWKELCGPCPKCGGQDRFHIYADRSDCHCRKCGKTWDAISLYADMENMSMYEAAKALTGIIEPARKQKPETRQAHTPDWESADWQEKAVALSKKARKN